MQGHETAKKYCTCITRKLNLTQKSNNSPDNLLIPTSLNVLLKIIFVDTLIFTGVKLHAEGKSKFYWSKRLITRNSV